MTVISTMEVTSFYRIKGYQSDTFFAQPFVIACTSFKEKPAMKNLPYLITLLLFCMILNQLSAQFSIGLKGGHARAWEDYGDTWLPEGARVHVNGINVSTLAYYRLGRHLQIGIEPGFVQRGAACIPGFLTFNSDTKLLLNYLELPIMVAANVSFFNHRLELFGKVGVSTSYITTAHREVVDLLGEDPMLRTKLDLRDGNMKRWDRGLHGNLGLGYQLGSNQLFFEVAHYYGLRDVDNFFTSKNRNLNLNLGYLIRLGGS